MWLLRRPAVAQLALLTCGLVLGAACSGPNNADPTAAPPSPSAATVAATSTATLVATPEPAATPRIVATASERATATLPATATATVPPSPTMTPTQEPTATQVPPTPTTAPTAAPGSGDDVLTLQRADTDEQIVALTFDAGADRGYAEQILDTLKQQGVVATFGMTGGWARDNPDLIHRMVNEGHQLINHTMTHRSWTGASTGADPLTAAERADELTETADIVRGIAGVELRPYFRPPYGDYDDSVLADMAANGYTVNVMWSVDSLGWAGRSESEIVQRVMDGAEPGAIYLFHVGAASQDAAALPTIIADLRAAGYHFVTIADMAGR